LGLVGTSGFGVAPRETLLQVEFLSGSWGNGEDDVVAVCR